MDEILPEDDVCSNWVSSSICTDRVSSTKCQLDVTDTDGARSTNCHMDLSLDICKEKRTSSNQGESKKSIRKIRQRQISSMARKDIITVENNNSEVKLKDFETQGCWESTQYPKPKTEDNHFNCDVENDALSCPNCIKKVITVGFCESLHCLQPTEMNLRVKGSVSSEESLHQLGDCSNLLKEGSLENAFLGNDNRTRILFQVISFKFDEAIKCVQVELSDGSEFSSNCIFSQTLTNQVQSHINLWSIIEVLEYDIIADKFIEVKRFEVRQKLSHMIGDPDPIEDGLFLKIHRGDFRTCICLSDQMLTPVENPKLSKCNRKSEKKVLIEGDEGESSMDGNHSSSLLIVQHEPCSKNNIKNEQISVQNTNIKECYVRLEMNVVRTNIDANEDEIKLKQNPPVKSSPSLKCGNCDYEVTSKRQLKAHIDAEHLGIRYFCDQCPYEAKAKRLVQRHVESTHDGIRFKCDKCNYQSTTKWYLRRHVMSTHNGIRFKCDQCNYQGKDKYQLKKHVKSTHDGIRFKCDECNYQGTRKWHLKRHIESIHEGIRHKCDKCNYEGKRRSDLKRHVDSTHDGICYKCDDCDYQGKTKFHLKRHIKNVHSESR